MMHDMGKAFHAPPRRDIRQWRKIELIVKHADGGTRFSYCTCYACSSYSHPQELSDAKSRFGHRRSARKNYQKPVKPKDKVKRYGRGKQGTQFKAYRSKGSFDIAVVKE